MTLVLIRHCETTLNAARVLQPADTPLSERGLAQARALAQRMALRGLKGIVSSDQPRALQTAQAIADAVGLPVQATPLLQERNFGALRGLPYDSLGFDPLARDDAPEGGESAADFRARVARAFDFVVALGAEAGGPLAVVTHGLVVKQMLGRHARLPAGVEPPKRISNASVSVLRSAPPHEAELIDCTRHLQGALRDDAHALSGG